MIIEYLLLGLSGIFVGLRLLFVLPEASMRLV